MNAGNLDGFRLDGRESRIALPDWDFEEVLSSHLCSRPNMEESLRINYFFSLMVQYKLHLCKNK